MGPDFDGLFDRPLIVLAAPRSGSTLLFETLAQAPELWSAGGESHRLIEGLKPLNPMFGMVDSNRLTARHATPHIVQRLRRRFVRQLRDREGRTFLQDPQPSRLRFLEKTPKNALRQPFLEPLFPGALYLHLFRDPRANISSMLEAWKSGRWVTYPRLPGWRGPPWSLLLPPGWQTLNGRPLPEICAFQWAVANRIILDDLAALPPERWMACDYAELTARPRELVERICAFADLCRDERLDSYLARPLPLSRFTQTAPDPEKWRRNERFIVPQLEGLKEVWDRCRKILGSSRV